MRNQVLLTGATGFIGRRIKGYKRSKCRINDYVPLWHEASDCAGIVHLAAVSNRREAEEDTWKCIQSNIVGLENVLKVAFCHQIWVLFISTYQVRDINLYGLTKLVGEELCRIWQKRGVRVRIVRFPIVYGPGDRPHKIVTRIISTLKSGQDPQIFNDRDLNFLYVDDAARIIENEVSILQGGYGKKYRLTDLVKGIKRCMNEKK